MAFEFDERNEPELRDYVFQALGAASMCWTPKGIFDDVTAKEIGDALMAKIEDDRMTAIEVAIEDLVQQRHDAWQMIAAAIITAGGELNISYKTLLELADSVTLIREDDPITGDVTFRNEQPVRVQIEKFDEPPSLRE